VASISLYAILFHAVSCWYALSLAWLVVSDAGGQAADPDVFPFGEVLNGVAQRSAQSFQREQFISSKRARVLNLVEFSGTILGNVTPMSILTRAVRNLALRHDSPVPRRDQPKLK